ncbi:MAG: DNA-3-methyladenine glycosylase 2 family protein [Anaerolineales bacterium]|nr:MAG: DNA-3-methyladenine glycosylase 2 family protein [Anaerolineales bacterium]
MMMKPEPLSEPTLSTGIAYLVQADADLARVVARLGPPPLWVREPGFPTLVQIILEQQVSLASARAAYAKLTAAAGVLTPSLFLGYSDHELREFGFSRQKTGYCRGLAQSIVEGRLDLETLEELSDSDVRSRLIEIKGIGPWTADIYLLMALRRPDIWPAGDLALAAAVQQVKNLPVTPTRDELREIAADWKPWRAVAARILWQHYLS